MIGLRPWRPSDNALTGSEIHSPPYDSTIYTVTLDGQPIGYVAWTPKATSSALRAGKTASVSITLREDQRGHGHGTAAMRLLLALIFRGPTARVEFVADTRNAPATRLARSVGFDLAQARDGAAVWVFSRERLPLLRAVRAMPA